MYQGPMSFPLLVESGGQTVVFGPFDPWDEVRSIVIQTHSSGSAAVVVRVEVERRAGSSREVTFGGGNLVTQAPFNMFSPVGFDSLVHVPVNVIFRQRELLVIRFTDQSASDDHIGLIGIVFFGGVGGRSGAVVSGGGGGGT